MTKVLRELAATPSKPFEVVIVPFCSKGEVVMHGASLPGLLPCFEQAVRKARADQKLDGRQRWVEIRQCLARFTV
jgi:hypothetical protein